MSSYVGKYRAIVVDTKDPENRGRIKVNCPKVYGDEKSPWCQPCFPYAIDSAGDFVLPKLNDFVWVEFEEGDVRYPIYTGGLWSNNNSPVSDYTKASSYRQIEFEGCKITFEKGKLVITNGSSTITMSDGTVTIEGDIVNVKAGTINLN